MNPSVRILITILAINLFSISLSAQNNTDITIEPLPSDSLSVMTDDEFNNYIDSIINALYPPVIPCGYDSPFDEPSDGNSDSRPNKIISVSNSHVPNSISIDKTKEVGSIAIESSTSNGGAKTYRVPLELYNGMNGCTPSLSLCYNSSGRNSTLGVGWSLEGISSIHRNAKNMYYDGKTDGVKLNNTDAFTLDGMRLIKIDTSGNYINYETESGNIKVRGYYTGNVIKYFIAYYPDGNKAIFGNESNTTNKLDYPITSFEDINGNIIAYSYGDSGNSNSISKISYNGGTVDFVYEQNRTDRIENYSGGIQISDSKRLKNIAIKWNNTPLLNYDLTYSMINGQSHITQIDCSSDNKYYNPIKLYYGTGNNSTSYTSGTTQLNEWYEAEYPGFISVVRGKFQYGNSDDGLATLPNKNSYFKAFKSTSEENYFNNLYSGSEKIYVYPSIRQSMVNSINGLITGAGFIDLFTADIDGNLRDLLVKVNNTVVNGKDNITIDAYKIGSGSASTNIIKKYSKTFSFSTVFTDSKGHSSVQPKFYYSGDFNGDGKMEILAISAHQPFGGTANPSKCYIFDIVNGKVLYEGGLLEYKMEFVGTQQTNSQTAANNSDKIFIIDYDGDGKSDLCHINSSGTHIYTFEMVGSSLTGKKIATYTALTRSELENKELYPCRINSDGLTDFLVSPIESLSIWNMYISKGDGQFVKYFPGGPTKPSSPTLYTGFLMQDVDQDGFPDLISFDEKGFATYLMENNKISSTSVGTTSFPSEKSILVSIDLNSRGIYTQLISFPNKGGLITKYSFGKNKSKEMLLTGMANSLGVVEKNEYYILGAQGQSSTSYTMGTDAVFPYVNFEEPIPVCIASDVFMNGTKVNHSEYEYEKAIYHAQGRGFVGFEKITSINNRNQRTVREFDPCNFSVIKKETSPAYENEYTFSTEVATNKLLKVRLTKKIEKDKLKNQYSTTNYTYDQYGYPTKVSFTTSDNLSIVEDNIYKHTTAAGKGYNLGFLIDRTTTRRNGLQTYTEREYLPVYSVTLRRPTVKVNYINGKQSHEENYSYDDYGNMLTLSEKKYSSSTHHKTTYVYDGYGRITKKTDYKGLSETYSYDSHGRVSSMVDYRGGTTTYTYGPFDRLLSTKFPDQTVYSTSYAWTTDGTNGLYSETNEKTGKPTVSTIFDPFGREVRVREKRFNGVLLKTDKLYDDYGNVIKESLPFTGASPSLWITNAYDAYNRLTSVKDPSGKSITYSYSGMNATSVIDGVSTVKGYNFWDQLVSVSDPSGKVTYSLRADGQPSSITSPGNVVTTLTYDDFGRRISLNDPSQGTSSYEYDSEGNLKSETNANGETTEYEYDTYGRLIKSSSPESVIQYSYNDKDELISVSSDNGSSRTYNYDTYGNVSNEKETAVDNRYLVKIYTYSNGNISSIRYATQSGLLGLETHTYANGWLSEVSFEGTSIYKRTGENALGLLTGATTGVVSRSYSYSSYGIPQRRTMRVSGYLRQDESYSFDATSGNLVSRTDHEATRTELFEYDGLNRLTKYGTNTVTYDIKGNITAKSDVGSFGYSISGKPYSVSSVSLSGNSVPLRVQNVAYTSFGAPVSIEENGLTAKFTYGVAHNRIKMAVSQASGDVLSRYYIFDNYEFDKTSSGSREKLYLAGNVYTAPVVYVRENGEKTGKLYYILRDRQGSITHILDSQGNAAYKYRYDPWGRLRKLDQSYYSPGTEPSLFLGRGYTGHEHLTEFGLINMNARLYDPVLGRFLSPDPYVQAPDTPQNFNRYSYSLNNPLKYVDKDGEWFIIDDWIFGAIKGLFNGEGMIKSANRHAKNSFNIWKGLFSVDTNNGFWGRAAEFISRFTYQLPQTLVGFALAEGWNTYAHVSDVNILFGATVVEAKYINNAVTIGNYIVGDEKKLKADPNNQLFQHEYGHYLQSKSMGWAYLSRVGIPSFLNTIVGKDHGYQPYEQDANLRAFEYFNTYVEGFYTSPDEYEARLLNNKGWDFLYNPLVSKRMDYDRSYVDYKDKDAMNALRHNLGIRANFLNYVLPVVGIFMNHDNPNTSNL